MGPFRAGNGPPLILEELLQKSRHPTQTDGAITILVRSTLLRNVQLSKRSKHIDIAYHCIRDLVLRVVGAMVWVPPFLLDWGGSSQTCRYARVL